MKRQESPSKQNQTQLKKGSSSMKETYLMAIHNVRKKNYHKWESRYLIKNVCVYSPMTPNNMANIARISL